MSAMLAWSVAAAQVLLGLAMACATFRILRGPRAQDRIVGFDSLYVNAMLLLLTFGIRSGSTLYFEAALIIALLGFVEHGSARQVPASWRGDRMNEAADVPSWAAIVTAMLLIVGAAITLIGCARPAAASTASTSGSMRPRSGTTLGTACIAVASMIYFSALGSRLVVHELLIVVFVTVTTPISLMILVRAATLRDAAENERTPPGQTEDACR